jgi:glutathione S-transferase
MTITLYELSAENPKIKFSPHCWKAHLALSHKNINFESEPVSFGKIKEVLFFVDYSLLPVLKDGDEIITDSWNIAEYLEASSPQSPSLFHDEVGKALAESINNWCNTVLANCIRPINWMHIYNLISEEDKIYFRQTREARIGMTLEEYTDDPEQKIANLGEALDKIREVLAVQKFLGGVKLSYADICLLATLMWLACVSDIEFLNKNDIVYDWYVRMLKEFPVAEKAVNFS